MFFLLLQLLASVYFIQCKQYLLTPKNNNGNLHLLSQELGLENVIINEHLSVYTASEKNIKQYKHTLSHLYDIEEDQPVTINDNSFTLDINVADAPWHLDRVAKRNLPLDGTYNYSTTGSCHMSSETEIYTYIVDTGIDISHNEFENRAYWGMNFADDKDTDCNNHGTHVAGIIGSRSYGVCKDANLIAVKVLDCDGSGSYSSVLRGLDWAYQHHKQMSKSKKTKSIINMSLGGGYSRIINKLVNSIIENDDNTYVVVAAGNEDQDACNVSPASSLALTVMASDKYDSRAWFSNWGKCADIYAPGVDIMSTIPHNKVATYSGTSMSSPVVAGIVNHYVDMYPKMNMKKLKEQLVKDSTQKVVKGTKSNTSNNLVFLTRSV